MKKDSKIYIAGHAGLVGSAIHRKLQAEGYTNIAVRTSRQLDLTSHIETDLFFWKEKPEYIFLAAAKVGGVAAISNDPVGFIYKNLAIQNNVIQSANKYGVKKLMFFGSNCIYPKDCPQPIKEEYLMSGPLEPTTASYALAKIAGIRLCQAYNQQFGNNFITVLPVNLYGPNDNYDLHTSHVMPALLKKFKTAKGLNSPSVTVWGTGNARREFLHVDDLADACLFLMLNYNDPEPINVGSGADMSIKELAFLIKETIGYNGEIVFDHTKPEGSMGKLLDIAKLKLLGWQPKISLTAGIKQEFYKL